MREISSRFFSMVEGTGYTIITVIIILLGSIWIILVCSVSTVYRVAIPVADRFLMDAILVPFSRSYISVTKSFWAHVVLTFLLVFTSRVYPESLSVLF